MIGKVCKFLFDLVISKTPECFRGLRNFFVRRYIKHAGKEINIGRMCKIHKNVSIGNNSGVGFACQVNNGVTIGNDVMIGPNVSFYTQNHVTADITVPMRCQGMTAVQPIIIEDDVWIGANVTILPGVTIGKGSVIGACALVSRVFRLTRLLLAFLHVL